MSALARRGLWALPVGGAVMLLASLPWVWDVGHPAAQYDPPVFARFVTSPVGIFTIYGYLVGSLCLLLGFVALYAHVPWGSAHRWAGAGMVLGVTSTLFLSGFAFTLLGAAVVADYYLSGHQDASALLGKFEGGSVLSPRLRAYAIVSIVVGLAGGVAMAVAIWRSGRLPKWIGIPLVGAFIWLIGGPISSVLTIFVGTWIAYRGGRRQPAQAEATTGSL